MSFKKFAMRIAYSGEGYIGWQSQVAAPPEGLDPNNQDPNSQEHRSVDLKSRDEILESIGADRTIQTVVRRTLESVAGERASVVASGRTDSGVHAVGQVAHFRLGRREWNPEHLRRGLNSRLPEAIRILRVVEVPMEFHAQKSASKKQYSFYFQQGPCALPQLAPYSVWIQRTLNVDAMHRAITPLLGTHEFLPFQASGGKPGPKIRTIHEAEVTRIHLGAMQGPGFGLPWQDDLGFSLVRVRVCGSGFLKQMVRAIAGTLLEVGEGRKSDTALQEVLQTGDRSRLGVTAQPRGLWLDQVWYSGFDI